MMAVLHTAREHALTCTATILLMGFGGPQRARESLLGSANSAPTLLPPR